MRDLGRFKFWSGDVDYKTHGGSWIWATGEDQDEYHYIRTFHWEEACGRKDPWVPAETYNVSLYVLRLALVPAGIVARALRSSDMTSETQKLWDRNDRKGLSRLFAGALFEYGTGVQVLSKDGNNWERLVTEAKRYSKDIAGTNEAMTVTVNRLGQTGEEHMRGEMGPAISRGLESGDPSVALLAGIYRHTKGQCLGGRLADIDPSLSFLFKES